MSTLNFVSVNVRGLRQRAKRYSIFEWLKRCHLGEKSFTLLQETHSTPEIESLWETDWGNKIIFNHGSSNSRGVLILLPKGHDYKIDVLFKDNSGRLMIIKIENDYLCRLYYYFSNIFLA